MLFSSYTFIIFFLPCVLLGTYLIQRRDKEAVILFLSAASLIFYGYWNWELAWVITVSIAVNFVLGRQIERLEHVAQRKKIILIIGVIFNLGLLTYFKYTNFLIENINMLSDAGLGSWSLILPLGISFFTFQQIAYLVDVYRNETHEHDFRHYLLFVTFFPQLIAGPIVHHKEMMPQFVQGRAGHFSAPLVAQGIAIFVIGLAKKVILADGIAMYATPVVDAAGSGVTIPLLEAWGGATAYTFQIYFDFSGYSDMAIGLGLMFGLRLPINFLSPYKANNLIDFWRCWHITLSRFLRDYLYIPLGGKRLGLGRRYVNLAAVMVLGGLWHGANWTFIIWGALHGIGLIINHMWIMFWGVGHREDKGSFIGKWLGRLITFIFLIFTWVFFRADDIESAHNIISGMVGLNGVVLPQTYMGYLGAYAETVIALGIKFEAGYLFMGIKQVMELVVLLMIVWFLPNTTGWTSYQDPAKDRLHPLEIQRGRLNWRPNTIWGLGLSGAAILCLVLMSRAGEFLYFQF